MSATKPFLSYQQQIDKLENEKNFVITDRDYAESVLKRIGYFALIGGYKKPFKNPTTQKYKDGTTFEEIVALYTFDESLRELYLRHMLRIERNVRSLLSYYFTQRFGEQQSAYLTAANYSNNPKYAKSITKLIQILNNLATSNDYAYIARTL